MPEKLGSPMGAEIHFNKKPYDKQDLEDASANSNDRFFITKQAFKDLKDKW